jgi:hypothetical protein
MISSKIVSHGSSHADMQYSLKKRGGLSIIGRQIVVAGDVRFD